MISRYQLVILGFLNELPMHGYQIDQEIKRRSMDIWANISMASIYNNLVSLENKGFISSTKEKSGNMPERKVYSITSKGTKNLSKLVMDGLERVEKYNDIVYLLSVGFIKNIQQEKALMCLNRRKDKLGEISAYIRQIHQGHKNVIPFNWLFIIAASLEIVKSKRKLTGNLIKQIEQNGKWEKK